MNIKHTIWNEKYRPNNLDTFICDDETKVKMQECIDKEDIPHLLFAGRAGSGKTTLAKILVNSIDCDYLYLNAADERSMDVMRDKVGGFASTATFKSKKIVILDEATLILSSAQVILLNMIETYSVSTRFILTGNYPERLIDPLRSRLTEYKLNPPTKPQLAKHLSYILTNEEVKFDINDVVKIINKFYPDVRRTINNTQKYCVNAELKLSVELGSNVDYKDELIKLLQKPTNKTWVSVRQLVADEGIADYDDIYRYIYDNINKFPGQEAEITLAIGEYLYRSTTILDKEINFMSFISQILTK
jgi:DNA polymerase III delta prime subunit